jgi:hypothetical protein
MITPKTMVEFALAEPFRPFRLHMASGRTFEVRHPEMIAIGRSALTVYAPPEGDETAPDRWQRVSYMLLESVEPLDARAPSGN